VVLYDWVHPQQHQFAQLAKLLRHRTDLDRRFRAYHSRFQMELALQRRAIKGQLHEALNRNCRSSYVFSQWQRTIRWKHADHPLCTVGSLLRGGRFNIGSSIDPTTFPPFSAFYAATDKDTAIQEVLGQDAFAAGLDAHELALARPDSVLTFSVSGRLDRVLDLHDVASVREFAGLIKDFKIPPALAREAKSLPVVSPQVVRSPQRLIDSLLNPNWRHVETLCEVPANSQLFGQIVMQAGIDGILYPSKLTDKDCLAIFPCNLAGGTSFIEIDDDCPDSTVGPERIDSSNWEACERTSADVRASPFARAIVP
jgi:hypothetical protein